MKKWIKIPISFILIIFTILVTSQLFVFLSDLAGNRITGYGFHCINEYRQSFEKCHADFSLNSSKYSVDKQNQWVVENGSIGIKRYENCAIINRRNWTCTYDDNSGEFGFKKGIEYNLSFADDDAVFRDGMFWYTSKLNYWITSLKLL